MHIELKSEKGKLSANQEAWVDAIQRADGEAYVPRFSDWPFIEQTFGR